MKTKHAMHCLATVVLVLAVSSAHPAGIVAVFLLLPAFTFRQSSRSGCFAAAAGYYAGALWPIAVGAKNFFGPDVSIIGAMAFWAVCAVLLALPYASLWTDRTRQLLWRASVALTMGVIPPLGVIGFASPLTAAGLLFPAWSLGGLVLSLARCGLIAAHLLRTAHEARPIPRLAEPYSYRNAAIIQEIQSGIFFQRVPVPFSVWKLFSRGGAPVNLGGPAVLALGGQRAAILICYEQVIPWTVLTAAMAHPTLFVGMSNDHWATGTPIPQWQALCLRAWSRLFRLGFPICW
jgi:hypothetical protein